MKHILIVGLVLVTKDIAVNKRGMIIILRSQESMGNGYHKNIKYKYKLCKGSERMYKVLLEFKESCGEY